jgi:hypothetical protein
MSSYASRYLLLGGVLVAALSVQAMAQSASVPDFSSNDTGWISIGGGEFVAVPGSPQPVTQDRAYRYVPNNTSEQPTYRISDISNPNLKQWAKDVMKKDNDEIVKGKIGYTARSSCKPAGVPDFSFFGVRPHYFLQEPKKVTIIYSGDAQVRHVYLDVPHSANVKPSWYGESVGHYEGDTLVVDTIGMNDKTFIDNYRTPHTEKLHVVERFKVTNGGQNLEVTCTSRIPTRSTNPGTRSSAFGRCSRRWSKRSARKATSCSSTTMYPWPPKRIFEEQRRNKRRGNHVPIRV